MRSKNIKESTGDSALSKRRNFVLRSLSFSVLVPGCLFFLWKGGVFVSALISISFCLVFYEWFKLVSESTFTFISKIIWFFSGLIYMTLAFRTFWMLAHQPGGNYLLMTILGLVWASDTGGYLIGSTFKGPKLAPQISPNKTWSGMIGGLSLTWITAHLIFMMTVNFSIKDLLTSGLIALPLSLIAQTGDLGESWMKRRFKVKDTGNLIPGHGGAIDRLDGVMAVGCALGILNLFGSYYITLLAGRS